MSIAEVPHKYVAEMPARQSAREIARLPARLVARTAGIHMCSQAGRVAGFQTPGGGRTMTRPLEIAPDVHVLPVQGTNVYFVRSGSTWVLIDTAWMNDGTPIREAADALYGPGARPVAILLTHAHADHAGAAVALARAWDGPVYLHPDELPTLRAANLLAQRDLLDPIGRALALVMGLFPRTRQRLMSLPELEAVTRPLEPGGAVPGLSDWRAIPTAGHSPGHVAFFRPSDRVLISGDAVITMRVTSPIDLLTGRRRLSLLPWIVCWHWPKTRAAVTTLAALSPRVLAPGHGKVMAGPDVAEKLSAFAEKVAK